MGKQWKQCQTFIFLVGSKLTANGDCRHEIKRYLLLGRKAMTNLDNIFKSWDITLLTKVCLLKAMVFPVVMYGWESWIIKKSEHHWTVVLEKTLESPLDCKEIQLVHPRGIRSWMFIERTDGEAEAPTLWPPDVKSWLIRKHPDAGKDWRQEEKRMTEYEMVGWHHWLDGHEFEQAPGVGEGQGSLVCCSPWGSQTAGHNLVTEQQQSQFPESFLRVWKVREDWGWHWRWGHQTPPFYGRVNWVLGALG